MSQYMQGWGTGSGRTRSGIPAGGIPAGSAADFLSPSAKRKRFLAAQRARLVAERAPGGLGAWLNALQHRLHPPPRSRLVRCLAVPWGSRATEDARSLGAVCAASARAAGVVHREAGIVEQQILAVRRAGGCWRATSSCRAAPSKGEQDVRGNHRDAARVVSSPHERNEEE